MVSRKKFDFGISEILYLLNESFLTFTIRTNVNIGTKYYSAGPGAGLWHTLEVYNENTQITK